MRSDVPEDDSRILGTDKSRNVSGRDLNGVEWWPVPSGALSQQHVPNSKGQSARRLWPWQGSLTFYHIHSTNSATTGAKSWKFSANMRKRCAFRVRYVLFFIEMLFRRYWRGGITFRHTYVSKFLGGLRWFLDWGDASPLPRFRRPCLLKNTSTISVRWCKASLDAPKREYAAGLAFAIRMHFCQASNFYIFTRHVLVKNRAPTSDEVHGR